MTRIIVRILIEQAHHVRFRYWILCFVIAVGCTSLVTPEPDTPTIEYEVSASVTNTLTIPITTTEASSPTAQMPLPVATALPPAISSSATPVPPSATLPPTKNPPTYIVYTVQDGDSLWTIAALFGLTVDEVRLFNNLETDNIKVGQSLTIPIEVTVTPFVTTPSPVISPLNYTVGHNDTLEWLSLFFDTTQEQMLLTNELSNGLRPEQQLVIPRGVHYVVEGESLGTIAPLYGLTIEQLRELNGLTGESDQIDIGQILSIRRMDSAESTCLPPRQPDEPFIFTRTIKNRAQLLCIQAQNNLSIASILYANPHIYGLIYRYTDDIFEEFEIYVLPEAGALYEVNKESQSRAEIANLHGVAESAIVDWSGNPVPETVQLGQQLFIADAFFKDVCTFQASPCGSSGTFQQESQQDPPVATPLDPAPPPPTATDPTPTREPAAPTSTRVWPTKTPTRVWPTRTRTVWQTATPRVEVASVTPESVRATRTPTRAQSASPTPLPTPPPTRNVTIWPTKTPTWVPVKPTRIPVTPVWPTKTRTPIWPTSTPTTIWPTKTWTPRPQEPTSPPVQPSPNQSNTPPQIAAVQPPGTFRPKAQYPWTGGQTSFDTGWCDYKTGFGWNNTLRWPTASHTVRDTREFRAGHAAIDIISNTGDAVMAAQAGVVVWAGHSTWGGGNVIFLDHGGGWQTLYFHLSQVNVTCHQTVTAGTLIGAVGKTGGVSWPHLHFGVHNNGSAYDPLRWLH